MWRVAFLGITDITHVLISRNVTNQSSRFVGAGKPGLPTASVTINKI